MFLLIHSQEEGFDDIEAEGNFYAEPMVQMKTQLSGNGWYEEHVRFLYDGSLGYTFIPGTRNLALGLPPDKAIHFTKSIRDRSDRTTLHFEVVRAVELDYLDFILREQAENVDVIAACAETYDGCAGGCPPCGGGNNDRLLSMPLPVGQRFRVQALYVIPGAGVTTSTVFELDFESTGGSY
jgi:hypothetical protein